MDVVLYTDSRSSCSLNPFALAAGSAVRTPIRTGHGPLLNNAHIEIGMIQRPRQRNRMTIVVLQSKDPRLNGPQSFAVECFLFVAVLVAGRVACT